MKAKIDLTKTGSNACNFQGDKDLLASYTVVAKTKKGFSEPITARVWRSYNADGAAPLYAAVWISSEDFQLSGAGKAIGYGYHKASTAIADALQTAGVILDEDISGRGDSAIRNALTATAKVLGFNNVHIVEL